MAGGPPSYIRPALRDLGWPCRVVTGVRATVEVIPGPDGEDYVVPLLPTIALPPCLHAPAIILSPIMHEIDIYHLPRFDGLVVADLQGFVRRPNVPSGALGHNVDLLPLLERVDVVKATPAELMALSAPSRQRLSAAVLLLTRGPAGAVVEYAGRTTAVPARPVSGVITIGAGDTFLACFTVEMLRGASPEDAGHAAARFTEGFLESRT